MARAGAAAAGLLWIAQAGAQNIFICVDASGRRLSSDRPILECLDREQRVLNASGTLNRKLSPSYTAAERAAIAEKNRQEAEERNRVVEERQRQRALLARYPDQESLDRDRASALAPHDEAIRAARQRSAALQDERRKLDLEAGRHAKDGSRLPGPLQHAIEESDRQLKAHERMTAGQMQERSRVALRFDEMQRQLNALWAQQTGVSVAR